MGTHFLVAMCMSEVEVTNVVHPNKLITQEQTHKMDAISILIHGNINIRQTRVVVQAYCTLRAVLNLYGQES